MSQLSHFDDAGASRMVDVSGKETTFRQARAVGYVSMQPLTLQTIRDEKTSKGNVFEVARLAGIMASKRTADLIPLCHPLGLDSVTVDFDFLDENTVKIEVHVAVNAKTGVEMEALTAVSVAALTVYDMLKAAQKDMRIGDIRVVRKTGGKSGDYRAD